MRVVIVHHECPGDSESLGGLVGLLRRDHGLDALPVGLRGMGHVLRRGDKVYGLLVFEAGHYRSAIRATRTSRAVWMGIPPPQLLAMIIEGAARRLGLDRVFLAAHESKRFRRIQERRMGIIGGILEKRGLRASYGFTVGEELVSGGTLVSPLTFFKGATWTRFCMEARSLGAECTEPLLMEGSVLLASWIAFSEHGRLLSP